MAPTLPAEAHPPDSSPTNLESYQIFDICDVGQNQPVTHVEQWGPVEIGPALYRHDIIEPALKSRCNGQHAF